MKLFVTAQRNDLSIRPFAKSKLRVHRAALYSVVIVFQTNVARGTVNKRLYAKDCLEVNHHKLYLDNL